MTAFRESAYGTDAVTDLMDEQYKTAVASRVREAWPFAEVVCYGSMRCGLSTPASDLAGLFDAPATAPSPPPELQISTL